MDSETSHERDLAWLTLSRSCDRFSRFFVRSIAPLGFAFIPELLAFGQRYLNLYFTVLEVHPGGDECQPALLGFADQLADLFFMYQELAGAQGRVVKDVAVLIRPNVAV